MVVLHSFEEKFHGFLVVEAVLFIFLISVIINKFRLPLHSIGIILGGICGVLLELYGDKKFSEFLFKHSFIFYQYWIPIFIVRIMYYIDSIIFSKSLYQILIISILGSVLFIICCGALLCAMFSIQLNEKNIVLMGTVLATYEVPQRLFDLDKFNNYETLMKGECVVVNVLVLLIQQIMYAVCDHTIAIWYQAVYTFIRYIVPGALIGVISGYIFTPIFIKTYTDHRNSAVTVLASSVSIYFLCENIIFTSGPMAVLLHVAILNQERYRLTIEVDNLIISYLTVAYTTLEATICIYFTIIIFANFNSTDLNFVYLLEGVVLYIVVNVIRLVILLIFTPILSRTGFGFDISTLFAIFWGNKKGAFVIVGIYMYDRFDILKSWNRKQFVVPILIYVFITYLISVNTFSIFLRKFGLLDTSEIRKVNISNCIEFIQKRGHAVVMMFKTNRRDTHINWDYVNEVLRIKNIYKNDSKNETESWNRLDTVCPSCYTTLKTEPTKQDLKDITNDIRIRILKAMRVSIVKQSEKGLLSREELRILLMSLETAANIDDGLVNFDDLFKIFRKKYLEMKIVWFLTRFQMNKHYALPKNKIQRQIYTILNSKPCDIIYILINIAFVVFTAVLFLKFLTKTYIIGNYIFTGIILLNQMLWLFALHYNKCCSSIKLYVKMSYRKAFDFAFFINDMIILTIIILWKNEFQFLAFIYALIVTNALRLLRIFHALAILNHFAGRLMFLFTHKMDLKYMYGFSLCKALLIAFEEALDIIPKLLQYKTISDYIKKAVEENRLRIMRELIAVQRERPWITVTVNTIQLYIILLKDMRLSILELRTSGYIDEYECQKLQSSLDSSWKLISKNRKIAITKPKDLVRNVAWLHDSPDVFEIIYSSISIRIWRAGTTVLLPGQYVEGVLLVISGCLKMSYTPLEEFIKPLLKNGYLPVKEEHSYYRLNENHEEYFTTGHTICELGVLTKRPYAAKLVTETSSEVFLIPLTTMFKIFAAELDPIHGICSNMWKCAMSAMIRQILQTTHMYSSITSDKINLTIQRGFVPDISNYKVLCVLDFIEDIVILDGQVRNAFTEEMYIAPSYIPRTARKLLIAFQNQNKEENSPKIFIIPKLGINEYDLMQNVQNASELISLRETMIGIQKKKTCITNVAAHFVHSHRCKQYKHATKFIK